MISPEDFARDFARGGLWKEGPCTIIKRAWENQYAVFLAGRCVYTTHDKDEALRFAAAQK
jgi:hypothetical protein